MYRIWTYPIRSFLVGENIFFTLFVRDFFNSSKLVVVHGNLEAVLFLGGGGNVWRGYIRRHKEKSRANCVKGFLGISCKIGHILRKSSGKSPHLERQVHSGRHNKLGFWKKSTRDYLTPRPGLPFQHLCWIFIYCPFFHSCSNNLGSVLLCTISDDQIFYKISYVFVLFSIIHQYLCQCQI
jgi:hypothetical protein